MVAIFGLSEKALQVTEERANLISNNLVNSGTPNYKAKDIDFSKIMSDFNQQHAIQSSHPKHIKSSNSQILGSQIQYRIPMQTSMDGNTVDPEIERKNFLENAMRYQVSLTFVQNESDQLMKAIKGD